MESNNYILHINTAGFDHVDIMLIGKKIFKNKFPVSEGISESLVPYLGKLIRSSRIKIAQISLISVGIGEGSFSGIRTGVAVANALSFAWNVPVVGIKSTDTELNFSKLANKIKKINAFVKPLYNKPPQITKPSKIRKF